MAALPLLPATVIGSWSFPGWYAKFCDDAARQPELFGPHDRDEAVRDAVRLAVDDQRRAGADLVADGEMQRVDFNLGFYDYLTGLFLALIERTVEGVTAPVSLHMCFGNYRGRAVGHRSYRPLFPYLARAKVAQLALEFTSREMAEIELAREIRPPMGLAVGLVDVKNTWVEPPELIAERLRRTLK
jgi:methionine synthase II (cobalamin-independent)